MKKLPGFLMIIIGFLPCMTVGQNLDSIWHEYQSNEYDTARVEALIELSLDLDVEKDSLVQICEMALELSKKAGYPRGIIYSYFRLGRIYDHNSEYKKALEYYLKRTETIEKLDLLNKYSGSYEDVGYMYYFVGNFE